MQLCLWSRTIQIYNMMKYENCLLCSSEATGKELQQSPIAGLPVYNLCQAKAFLTRLWLREEENISHAIENMTECIIIRGNCTFQPLNMNLKRNVERRKQQGVVVLTSETSVSPPPSRCSLLIPCFQLLLFDWLLYALAWRRRVNIYVIWCCWSSLTEIVILHSNTFDLIFA